MSVDVEHMDALELQRQHQAMESVFSLVRSLGNTLDVSKVAKLSLMTVTGQLLVRKAAFYLQYPNEDSLQLCQSLGVRRVRLSETQLRVPPALHKRLREEGGVATLTTSSGLSPAILAHFDYATYLEDGDRFVGLLLLGGKLSGRDFDQQDLRVLQTMGMVMGTALQKAIVHEQVAKAMERLQEAEALRKQIIDHVSHEFNTPILVIKDSMDLFDSAHPEMKEELSSMHQEAVQRLEQLVRGILLVSDAERIGREHEVEMSQDDFENAVLDPLLQRGRDRGHGVWLATSRWGNLGVRLCPSRLGVALESILDNGWLFVRDPELPIAVNSYATSRAWWEAQDHQGRISLYADLLAAGDAPEEPCFVQAEPIPAADDAVDAVVVIEVVDAGIGIPEDELRKVFEPFTQARNSPTRGVRGAGMGLTASRKLLRDMGGDVIAVSREGQGSLFAMMLPVRATG